MPHERIGRDGISGDTFISLTAAVHTNGKLCKESPLPHSFLLCLCVVSLSQWSEEGVVLLWFDAFTLPCHWGVRSLVRQE